MINLISEEDIIAINENLGHQCLNEGSVKFLISKIKSMKLSGNKKKDLSKIAAHIWYYIIHNHPFVDGNKRTATESMLLFLELNKAYLKMMPNGLIYISLKIANSDITLQELERTIYNNLEVKK
jgi:death-on-curing family protein